MFDQTNTTNNSSYLKIIAKKEQIKIIDIILEELCVKELNHDGRKFLKHLRENLKYEMETLNKPAKKTQVVN